MEVEICAESASAVAVAAALQVERIELCAALDLGGLTPSSGQIFAARQRFRGALIVLIRPRPGDFRYSADEIEIMQRDILAARELGADGFAIGALDEDGRLDLPLLKSLIAVVRPAKVTLHRAFDLCLDLERALESALDLGFDRILTSGGAGNALEGAPMLARLTRQAAGRISIMAGGGVTPDNIDEVLRISGVGAVHFSARLKVAIAGSGPSAAIIGEMQSVFDSERAKLLTERARIKRSP